MTRQQRRNAERRARKFDFPFPEHQGWLQNHLHKHPEVFVQVRGNHITTNLSGATEDLDVVAFHDLLVKLKGTADTQNKVRGNV